MMITTQAPATKAPVTVRMTHPAERYVLEITAKFDRAPSGKNWAVMAKRYADGVLVFASVKGRWNSPEDAARGLRSQVAKSAGLGWVVVEAS